MIEKLFGTSVTVITVTSEENFRYVRNEIMNANPGLIFLKDSNTYTFPQKFKLVYNWNLMSCSMVILEEELIV
jgi:hypothetical protein